MDVVHEDIYVCLRTSPAYIKSDPLSLATNRKFGNVCRVNILGRAHCNSQLGSAREGKCLSNIFLPKNNFLI